jgi:hypothetical protein
MRTEIEEHFLNPARGSAAARAAEFGTDLTLTLENLRLTPEERVRKLDSFIKGVTQLEAIQEAQALKKRPEARRS